MCVDLRGFYLKVSFEAATHTSHARKTLAAGFAHKHILHSFLLAGA
jgi:hypothetical protein